MSEVRLIDANALKQDLRRYFTDGVLDGVSARLAFNQILHDIDNAPTVEAYTEEDMCNATSNGYDIARTLYERPQGEWNYFAEEMGGIRMTGECPNCKQRRILDNFCSNCGADMRKGGAE